MCPTELSNRTVKREQGAQWGRPFWAVIGIIFIAFLATVVILKMVPSDPAKPMKSETETVELLVGLGSPFKNTCWASNCVNPTIPDEATGGLGRKKKQ